MSNYKETGSAEAWDLKESYNCQKHSIRAVANRLPDADPSSAASQDQTTESNTDEAGNPNVSTFNPLFLPTTSCPVLASP